MLSRLNMLALATFSLLAAGLGWAYQRFVDAEYDDGWWVLAELLATPLTYPDTLGVVPALACLGASTGSVTVTTWCALSLDSHRKLILVGCISAIWACSPWHVAALQVHGVTTYLATVVIAALALVSRLKFGPRTSWIVATATLLTAITWLSVSHSLWLPKAPSALFAPSPAVLSPWATPYAFSEPLILSCVWVLLHLSIPLTERAAASLNRALFPALLIFGLWSCGSILSVSEQVQVRANPRLALLYSLAYSKPNAIVDWLALEHFSHIGGIEQAAHHRQRLVDGSDDVPLPDTYAYPVSCVSGRPTLLDSPDLPQLKMLRRHMEYHSRCFEVPEK